MVAPFTAFGGHPVGDRASLIRELAGVAIEGYPTVYCLPPWDAVSVTVALLDFGSSDSFWTSCLCSAVSS